MTTNASSKRVDRDSHFWDRLSRKYARDPVANPEAYEYKLKKTQEYMRPDMTVLEIACGTGSTAITHAKFVEHIRAIDFSAQMIRIAQGKARDANITNIDFAQLSIDDLDPNDGPYDVVMAHSCLHLVQDMDAVLQKVHSLLRPGGVFVSSTVCLSGTMSLLRLVAPIGRVLGILPVINSFSQDDLTRSIMAAGLSVEHVWTPDVGRAVFVVAIRADDAGPA